MKWLKGNHSDPSKTHLVVLCEAADDGQVLAKRVVAVGEFLTARHSSYL